MRRSDLWTAWMPAILAFAIFLSYLARIAGEPFVRHLVANPLVYDGQAGDLLAGVPRAKPFFLSPLYPAFMAAVYFLSQRSRLALLAVQGVMLGLNVAMLAIITRRLLSRFAAAAASLIMAFYWPFHYFAGEILPTTLCISFMLAAILAFTDRSRSRLSTTCALWLAFAGALFMVYAMPAITRLSRLGAGSASSTPPSAYWAALAFFMVFALCQAVFIFTLHHFKRSGGLLNLGCAGTLVGVSGLVWSGSLVLAPVLVVMLLWEEGRRFMKIGVLVMGVAIPIAASLVHNYTLSGEFTPVTTSFGVNLFIGSNPGSDGMDPFKLGEGDMTRIEADRLALAGKRRSDFFRDQALRFITGRPREWLGLLGRKAVLSLTRFEIDNNADISERRHAWEFPFLPLIGFGLVFPLAAVGMLRIPAGKRSAYMFALGYAGFLALGVIFFACERFRLPGVVLLIPLAAHGLTVVIDDVKRKAGKRIAAAFAVIAIAAVISNKDWLSISGVDFASITVNKAYVERLSGNVDVARTLALAALEAEPGNAGALFQLGAIAESTDEKRRAVEYYIESLERDPFNLASYAGARRILESIEVSPAYLDRLVDQVIKGRDFSGTEAQIMAAAAARLD